MSLIGSAFCGFAQNTIHGFQNTLINSQWHCLRQMPQKRTENLILDTATVENEFSSHVTHVDLHLKILF